MERRSREAVSRGTVGRYSQENERRRRGTGFRQHIVKDRSEQRVEQAFRPAVKLSEKPALAAEVQDPI